MKRRLNKKAFVCLVGVVALSGAAVYFVHGVQTRRHAHAFLDQADREEQKGRLQKAADYVARYLYYAPSDTDALARYGQLLVRTGNREQVARAFLVLEKVLRQDSARHDIRRQLVTMAMAMNRFSDAREHLKLLRVSFPQDAELENLLGMCHEASEDYASAADCYLQAIRHQPTRVQSYVRLARVLRRPAEKIPTGARSGQSSKRHLLEEFERKHALGLWGAGLACSQGSGSTLVPWTRLALVHPGDWVMDALVVANPKSYQAYLVRAAYRREFRAGDPAPDVAQAAALAPDEADVLLESKRLAQDRGDFVQARNFLERGIQRDPKDVRMYQGLADVEGRAGHSDKAIACLRRGLQVLPNDRTLLWALAEMLIQDSDRPAADEIIARLEKAGEPAVRREYLKVLGGIRDKQWFEAARLLESLYARLEPWPDLRLRANWLLAQCYEELGDADRKLVVCRRAVTLDSASALARSYLGAALFAQGRLREAVGEFRRMMVLAGAPSSGWKMLAQALIYSTLRLPAADRSWLEAENVLRRAAEVEKSLDVLLLQAEILVAKEQFSQARELLEKARAEQPKEVRLWLALADLARRQQKPLDVLATLDEAERRLGHSVELELARARLWARRPAAEARKGLAQLAQNGNRVDMAAADRPRLLAGLAEAYYSIGDNDEAVRLWTRAAAAEPQNLRLRLRLFDLALQSRDAGTLRRVVDEIHHIEGEDGAMWRYGEAALAAISANKNKGLLAGARQHLAEVATRRPNWPRVAIMEGLIAELDGNPVLAAQKYRHAISLGDRQPNVVRRLVELLFQQGRYLEADEVIQKLPQQVFLKGDFGQLAVSLSLRLQNSDRALEWARQTVPVDSKNYRDFVWLGMVLEATDQQARAEASFRRAIALAGNVPDPWVALIQHLARSNQVTRAEEAIREAERSLGDAPLAFGQCFEAIGRRDRAEIHYQKALSASPKEASVLRSVASFYLRGNQFTKARPCLDSLSSAQVKAEEGDRMWARRALAVARASNGKRKDFEAALDLLNQNIRLSGGSVEDERLKVLLFLTQPRRRKDAIDILEDLVGRRAAAPEDQLLLAQLYDADGDPARARELMASLLANHGNNPKYIAAFVDSLLRRQKDIDKARLWLGKLKQVEPGSFRTLALRVQMCRLEKRTRDAAQAVEQYALLKDADLRGAAELLEQLGQQSSAEKTYRQLVAQSKRPDSVLTLAQFLARRKRLAEALALCDQAWQTCPPTAVAATCLAVIGDRHATPDQYRQVERRLEAAYRKAGGDPSALQLLLALGHLQSLQGRYEQAADFYRQVLERDPRDVLALNNLAWLLAIKFGKGDKALRLINLAIEEAGPRPSLLDTRAVVYLARRESARAIVDLTKSLAQAPTSAAYFHLAQARWLAKEPKDAAAAWEKAHQFGWTSENLHPLERRIYQEMRERLKL
jgi:tetratricopeptide (TPR) repeat protein